MSGSEKHQGHGSEPEWVPVPPQQHASPPERSRNRGLIIGRLAAFLILVTGAVTTVLVVNHRADLAAAERRAEVEAAAEEAEKKAAAEEAAREEDEARAAAELAERQRIYDSCVAELGPLGDSLNEIDARLDVGLRKPNSVPSSVTPRLLTRGSTFRRLARGCLSAGVVLEKALNAYITANNRWNDCITDLECHLERDVDGFLQKQWLKAAGNLDEASATIDRLDPAGAGGQTTS